MKTYTKKKKIEKYCVEYTTNTREQWFAKWNG